MLKDIQKKNGYMSVFCNFVVIIGRNIVVKYFCLILKGKFAQFDTAFFSPLLKKKDGWHSLLTDIF